MSGSYNGAKTRILQSNPFAIFSACARHSLNLCGVHAAEFYIYVVRAHKDVLCTLYQIHAGLQELKVLNHFLKIIMKLKVQ